MFGHVPDMPRRPVWDAEHAEKIARLKSAEALVDADLVAAIPVARLFSEKRS